MINNYKKRESCISLSIVVFFSFILVWRLFRGFDWSDDSYYSAIVYRIVQGDSLFQEIWDIHQLSAAILVPLFWVYTHIVGTFGIILFSRIVFALILIGEAIGLYFKFKDYYGSVFSTLASIILLSISSNCGLSYNTMMIEAYAMAVLFLPSRNAIRNLPLRYLLSGLCCGIAIQSYPTTGIVFPFFIAYIRIVKKKTWRDTTCFILGGLIVIISFVIFLSINSSFKNLYENFRYLSLDPEHGKIHVSLMKHYEELKALAGKSSILILLIADLTAILSWFTKNKTRYALKIFSTIGLLSVLIQQVIAIRLGYGLSAIQYRVYFALALIFPTLWLLDGLRWNNLTLLYLGGMIISIGVSLSTNNDATFYIYPYLFSAIATVLYIGKNSSIICRKKTICSIGSAIPIALLAVFSFVSSINYVYRDESLSSLNTRLRSGPAAGIYTTSSRAEQYEETIEAINTYIPHGTNVLFSKLLPFGYLCADIKPATPRLWRTNLDYPLFDEYYRNNPHKKPNEIFIVNEKYGITNREIRIGEYMQSYIDENMKQTVEIASGLIIYLKEYQ